MKLLKDRNSNILDLIKDNLRRSLELASNDISILDTCLATIFMEKLRDKELIFVRGNKKITFISGGSGTLEIKIETKIFKMFNYKKTFTFRPAEREEIYSVLSLGGDKNRPE